MQGKTHIVDLTNGPVWRQLMLFFLPILAGSLLQQLYVTVDAVIIGQFAGKTGLAAIDSVNTLLRLPTNFFVGLSTGATIIISHLFGAKKEAALSSSIHTAVAFALLGGLILSGVGLLTASFWVHQLDVPQDISGLALAYVRIHFSGFALSMLYNISAGILRAIGDSRTPFLILILSSTLNVVLDLLFVGKMGLSVAGAALATVIAQGFSALLVLHALSRLNAPYRFRLKKLRLERSRVYSFMTIGLPIALQSSLYPIANMLIQSRINSTGTDNIAAWALCGKMDFLIWLVTDSLAAAISTFVAQNEGAGLHQRARHGTRTALWMTLSFVALQSTILYLWNQPFASLFIDAADADILPLAGRMMRFLSPLYVFYVFGEIYSGAIRGSGETFHPMLITMLTTCATRILWILVVVPRYDSIYVILSSFPISWVLTSVAFAVYYHRFSRKRLSASPSFVEGSPRMD